MPRLVGSLRGAVWAGASTAWLSGFVGDVLDRRTRPIVKLILGKDYVAGENCSQQARLDCVCGESSEITHGRVGRPCPVCVKCDVAGKLYF